MGDLTLFVMSDTTLNARNEIVIVAEWEDHQLMFEPIRRDELLRDPGIGKRVAALAGEWVDRLRAKDG